MKLKYSAKNYKFKEKYGGVIAFIGMDGTGKTTLATETVAYLKGRGTEAVYLKPFEYIFLKYLINLFKKENGGEKNFLLKKGKKFFLLRLWPIFALVDNWFYYLIKIKKLLRCNQYVVCDRYFYDFATSFEHYGYSNRFFYDVYLRLIPRPLITIVLDAEIEIAHKRADELDDDYYRQQRTRYLELARKMKFNIIGTEKDLPLVKEEAINLIKPIIKL